MSGYHILIFFCRYAHIMIQGHMIYFCCTIVKLCELKFQPSAHLSTNHSSAAASGWAGWALAHPEFGSSVNPITTRGGDYAHHITASPPGFENPAASLRYDFKGVQNKKAFSFKNIFISLCICLSSYKPLTNIARNNIMALLAVIRQSCFYFFFFFVSVPSSLVPSHLNLGLYSTLPNTRYLPVIYFLSYCHYSDVIHDLLNAFRLKRK